jgi:hypothetical protein
LEVEAMRKTEAKAERADVSDWENRVRALEDEGLTRSDAQAVVDAEDLRKGN